MKGQFMMISAIIIGLIVLSASSTISSLQSTQYSSDESGYTVRMIIDEASKVDMNSLEDRQNFVEMVDMVEGYRTSTEYSSSERCFNVTLRRTDEVFRLRCIS